MTTENQSRLTLGELLLTTAIVAALASLLLPVFAQDRERVGRAASAARYRSNERTILIRSLATGGRTCQADPWLNDADCWSPALRC